jgi:hypothetical protein
MSTSTAIDADEAVITSGAAAACVVVPGIRTDAAPRAGGSQMWEGRAS